jgi:hypothetical protein
MKRTVILGLAVSLVAASAAFAQTAPQGEPSNQTAEQNQKMTQQYNSLVTSNPGFKTNRMHKECDSITAADLKQQCMASFGGGNAMGSMGSAPKR